MEEMNPLVGIRLRHPKELALDFLDRILCKPLIFPARIYDDVHVTNHAKDTGVLTGPDRMQLRAGGLVRYWAAHEDRFKNRPKGIKGWVAFLQVGEVSLFPWVVLEVVKFFTAIAVFDVPNPSKHQRFHIPLADREPLRAAVHLADFGKQWALFRAIGLGCDLPVSHQGLTGEAWPVL